MRTILSFLLALIMQLCFAQNNSILPFLPTQTTGAAKFILAHPQYNGDSVLIVIVDSGVDVSVPGLKKLPDGKTKIIDVLDCSGEGDFSFDNLGTVQSDGGNKYLLLDNMRLYGINPFLSLNKDGQWWGGLIRESHYTESILEDLNEDGDNNDEFPFIIFKTKINGKEKIAAVIDLNGDHHFDDEKMILNYRERYDTFFFRNAAQNEKKARSTFALNIFPEKKVLSLHSDGGGHGTHVAGIAAGYKINGEDGYNGIAPGARIISCKIGDNRRSGGASTTGSMIKAFQFGLKRAKELKMPVVFNLSYGIGSVHEGSAEMEIWLNDFLEENPQVVVCTSNGNSGPGFSSSGLPASSSMVISSAALMEKENAKNVYGATITHDKVFYFSSRGGSVLKPDVLTPGAAASTVPQFEYDENMWGTSMASPQTTGLVALLLSAIHKQKLPVHNQLVKRALLNSSQFLPEYALPDQGAGIPNIEKALQIYKKLVKRLQSNLPIYYQTSVNNPAEKGGRAQAFFWNDGVLPHEIADNLIFNFRPVFNKDIMGQDTTVFEAYKISVSAPWLKTLKKYSYIKNRKLMQIPVVIDKRQLEKPGVYSAKLFGVPKNMSLNKKNILFENWVTIVVPDQLSESNQYHRSYKIKSLESGDLKRFFISVPTGIKNLVISAIGTNEYSNNRIYLFDPDGRKISTRYGITSDRNKRYIYLSGSDLIPGVYEIDLFAHYSSKHATSAQIDIYGFGASIENNTSRLTWNGEDEPGGKLDLFNGADKLENYLLSAKLKGFYRSFNQINSYSDFSSMKIPIPQNISTVILKMTLPDEDYQKMTDVAVQVVDETGEIIVNTGLNYPSHEFSFDASSDKQYYLEVYAGFARDDRRDKQWAYNVKIWYAMQNPIDAAVYSLDSWGSHISLSPWKKEKLRFQLNSVPSMLPLGFMYWMNVYLQPDGFDYTLHEKVYLKNSEK